MKTTYFGKFTVTIEADSEAEREARIAALEQYLFKFPWVDGFTDTYEEWEKSEAEDEQEEELIRAGFSPHELSNLDS